MDYKEMAKSIIMAVGGKNNVTHHYHCATRLRLNINDLNKVDYEKLDSISGVSGVVTKSDQVQIIIGDEVRYVYPFVEEMIPLEDADLIPSKKTNKKKGLSSAMEAMAGIFAPIIPIIAGAGLLKTFLTICTQLHWLSDASDTYQILYIAADTVFTFIPILIAYSAAKAMKTNIMLALTITAALFYPTILNAISAGTEYMYFLGIPVKIVDSSSTVIPILLAVFVLKYVYSFVDRLMPKALKMFFTSFIVLLIMIPLTLILFAPLGSYFGVILMKGLTVLINSSKLISGAIIGAFWIPLVVTGMHHGVIPLLFQEIASTGSTILMPATNMANVALAASVVGVLVRSKNMKMKTIAAAATPSGLMGITEPGIYGVMIKYKSALIGTMVGGAVGGAYIVMTDAVQYFFGGLGVFTPLMNLGNPKFFQHVIATVLSFAVSFIIVALTFKESQDDIVEKDENDKFEGAKKQFVKSPLSGQIIPLIDVEDEVFSSGAMGQGIAIEPNEGKIYAPFDGRVSAITPTKHAIGLTSESGVEVLIHVGMDTVNLQGKYFHITKNEGERFNKGEVLLEFDIAKIREAGYPVTTPVIVTNYKNYDTVQINDSVKNIDKTATIFEIN